jgi:hypothetical protein
LREATSVYKGWVVVGLVLLVSGLASFQVINSPAYAQLLDNDTVDTSSATNLPSSLIQNQLSPDQDALIATPGPSSEDLDPPQPQEDPSNAGGDERGQQTPTPNTEISPDAAGEGQSLDTGETIENSIVQSPAPRSQQPENSQPGFGEPVDQPSTEDNNDNNAREGQRGNQEADEADDSGGEEEEEDEEDEEEEEEDVKDGSKVEIPSSLRNWLPFP